MVAYLVLPLVIAAAGGAAIRRFAAGRWQVHVLLAWLFLPLVVYTVLLWTAPPSEGGSWGWWLAGLIYLAVPLAAWLGGSLIGFAAARSAAEA